MRNKPQSTAMLLCAGALTLPTALVAQMFPASGLYEQNFDAPGLTSVFDLPEWTYEFSDPENVFDVDPLPEFAWDLAVIADESGQDTLETVGANFFGDIINSNGPAAEKKNDVFNLAGENGEALDLLGRAEQAGGMDFVELNGIESIPNTDVAPGFLVPKVPARSYADLPAFEGRWLINQDGVGPASDFDGAGFTQKQSAIARLSWTDLPPHQSIGVFFDVAAGGFYETNDNVQRDGNFELRISDDTGALVTIIDQEINFNNGGADFSQSGGRPYTTQDNLLGGYREQWVRNRMGDVSIGPRNVDNRVPLSWANDSAYDMTIASLATIPHSVTDNLTIEFVHRASESFLDEHFAIDNVRVVLNEGLTSSELDWPSGNTYVENFDGVRLGLRWNLSAWEQVDVPTGGVAQVTGTGSTSGLVRTTDNTTPTAANSFLAANFPLDAVEPPSSFAAEDAAATGNSSRFGGSWLRSNLKPFVTAGSPGDANNDGRIDGVATVTFNNLPEHTGIDIDFLLGALNSIDIGGDLANQDLIEGEVADGANFAIKVDNEEVIAASVSTFGVPTIVRFLGSPPPAEDPVRIRNIFTNEQGGFSAGNFDSVYGETWVVPEGAAGPQSEADRTALNWQLDAGFDAGLAFDTADDSIIPHTADTLTIEFIHGLNGDQTDETIAIEQLRVTLIGTPDDGSDFQITDIVLTGGLPTITFESVSGSTYTIERSTDLGDWSVIGTPINAAADSTEFTDNSPPAGTRVFYRVRESAAVAQ